MKTPSFKVLMNPNDKNRSLNQSAFPPVPVPEPSSNMRVGDENGFTLVELMIVVVIIGILAAIAVPVFATQQREAIIATVKSDVASTRPVIPDTDALAKPTGKMRTQAVVTGTNKARYFVNTERGKACYDVTHEFSKDDTVSYYYSTETGKLKQGTCSDFEHSPDMEQVIITPGDAETPIPDPGGGNRAECANTDYVVQGPATISCEITGTSATTTNVTLTVTGTSTIPSGWSVNADFSKYKDYGSFTSWAHSSLFNGSDPTGTSKTYTFKGTDMSWNHEPTHEQNWLYISSKKAPVVFTVQLIKKP